MQKKKKILILRQQLQSFLYVLVDKFTCKATYVLLL